MIPYGRRCLLTAFCDKETVLGYQLCRYHQDKWHAHLDNTSMNTFEYTQFSENMRLDHLKRESINAWK